MIDTTALSLGGWTLEITSAALLPLTGVLPESHGLFSGDDFSTPRRGVVAAIARGRESDIVGREAAQTALHGFTEGYFGATATVGTARAAGHALTTINGWLHHHSGPSSEGRDLSVSFSGLLFTNRTVSVVQVGTNRIYRLRGQQLQPLSYSHLRRVNGKSEPARAVGADRNVHIDFSEESAEIGDRYLLMSAGAAENLGDDVVARELRRDSNAATVAETLLTGSPGGTILVVDVVSIPQVSLSDLGLSFSHLPLRPPPKDGETLDGFLLVRTLYRSRYTLLKLAHDTVENREVVLKLPLPSMLQDTVFRAGFMREGWIGSTVRSPWIAQYIDLPADRRSCLYLALPYYRGETLERRLLRSPPLSFGEGLSIAFKLCNAVADLGKFQVIHRDLKPENIILLPNGELRLLDLGLAYLPGIDDPDDSRLGGTTRYIAPELFGKTPAGARSEVFSIGITLYRMFSGGEFPYGRRETYPLAKARPDLPPWFGMCLKAAISIDPEQRYADAESFFRALDEGVRHGMTDGPGDRGWRGWLKTVQIWQALTALFALAFLVSYLHATK